MTLIIFLISQLYLFGICIVYPCPLFEELLNAIPKNNLLTNSTFVGYCSFKEINSFLQMSLIYN